MRYDTKIGTWNVQTMIREGKLKNLKSEIERHEVNKLVISEVRGKIIIMSK